jgi:thiamine-monophosphate kinase
MTRLNDIGEDALIERLVALAPADPSPGAGPGDDCAVVDFWPGGPLLQLLKTDAMVAGIHFLADSPARAVGWKAVARVISDIAAMAGTPDRFLVTLALPASTNVAWAEDVYRGIGDCLREFGCVLAGGETTRVPDGSAAVISIAATGTVARNRVVLRSTAAAGDVLVVTGRLGGSLAGKHLSFTPRVRQAHWLAEHHMPTAMMDLSDGLAKDLPRLADASCCGFRLDFASLPLTPGSSIEQALGDGEDFELLATVPPARVDALLRDWSCAFPDLEVTPIGRLVAAGQGDTLHGGWDHFANQ